MNEASRQEAQHNNEEIVVVRLPQAIGYVQLRESLEELEDTSADIALLFWIFALLFFGLGDTVSSFMVFSRGGGEMNPIMAWTLSLPGGLLAFVLVKTAAISVLYSLAYFWEGAHRWMIPLLLMVFGLYLTISNTRVVLGQTPLPFPLPFA